MSVYAPRVQEYLDSVEGKGHQSAVRIIEEMQAEIDRLEDLWETARNLDPVLIEGIETAAQAAKELRNADES